MTFVALRPPILVVAISSLLIACSDPNPTPNERPVSVTLRIGSLDNPDSALSRVEGITTNPDGHIFILQHEDGQVREYNSTGRFVRTIGRRGVGPGEFSLPTKMWWFRGDLWVADGNLLRASRFDRTGSVLQTRNMAAPATQIELRNVELVGDTFLLGTERVIPGHPRFDRDSTPLVLVRGNVADTVAWLDVRNAAALVGVPGRTFIQTRHPISDSDVFRILPDRKGFIVARRRVERGRATVQWFDSTGVLVREHGLALPALPVPASISDSILDWFSSRLVQSGSVSSAASGRDIVRAALHLPDHYPIIGEVIVGSDGTVWISRGRTETGEVWVQIDHNGKPKNAVRIPRGVRILHIDPNRFFGVTADRAGVPIVVRLTFQ